MFEANTIQIPTQPTEDPSEELEPPTPQPSPQEQWDAFMGSFDDPYRDYIGRKARFSDDMAQAIMDRCESWKQAAERNGVYRQARENYQLYHNAEPGQNNEGFTERSFALQGANGEYLRVRFNDYRATLKHILNMTTSQKPALQAKAANNDPDSLIAAQLWDGVVDYFLSQWKRSRTIKQIHRATEMCLFTPNGYLLTEWDAWAGDPITPNDDGQVVRKGDLYVKFRSFWDVYFDLNLEDDDELDWVIVRDYYNKYELAERFPDRRDDILRLKPKTEYEEGRFWGYDEQTDMVCVYKLYHRSTSVLPHGRVVWVCDSDLLLLDDDNPYVDDEGQAIIPLLTIRSGDGLGTLLGYPTGNDLAPVQMGLNMTASGVLTNEAAFGVGNISAERGSDLSMQSLAGGLNVIEYAQGKQKPEPFSVSSNESQSLNVIGYLEKTSDRLSGMNSVARGNPDDALKAASGRALGLLQSMAVQFNSDLQASYQQLVQDWGNLALLICKRFATTEQITSIVGKDRAVRLATWTGETFRNVSRVVAEPVNPLSKTTAGARDEAEFLAERGWVSTPQEYLTVRNTGQLEPLFKADQAQLNLISQENESMLKMEPTPVLATDRHDWHIPEHLALLASPSVRVNGAIVQFVLAHVQQHQQLAAAMTPPPQEEPSGGSQTQAPQKGAKSGTEAPARADEQQAQGMNGQQVPVPNTASVTPGMQGA